jgi:hypothetical protein
MIFAMLLTSSNYNDKEERMVGGRNGLGGKTTCIFSKTFKIETANNGLHYTQEITENTTVISKPKIKKTTKKDYTKISYLPDFKRLKVSSNKSPAFIGTMELIESKERQYLINNQGCFRCRAIIVDQTNGFGISRIAPNSKDRPIPVQANATPRRNRPAGNSVGGRGGHV